MPHPAEPRLSSQMLLLSPVGKRLIPRIAYSDSNHSWVAEDYQAPKGEALNSSGHTCGAIEIQYRSATS